MFKNKEGLVRSGWLIMLSFIAIYFVQSFVAVPGMIMLATLEGFAALETSTESIMLILDGYPWLFLFVQGGGALGGVLITMVFWRFVNKKSVRNLGFSRSRQDLLFGLGLGALAITLVFIILLGTGQISLETSLLRPEFSIYSFTFLLIFIIGAVFEEIFFRGYIMRTMGDRGNAKWVIYLVSALFFSVVHGANPNVSILGLVNILLVGLLFAYMFDVTKRLWLPIGYHFTWNYFQGNIFGFPVSGLEPHGIYQVDTSVGNDLITGGTFGIEGGLLATLVLILSFVAVKTYYRKQ